MRITFVLPNPSSQPIGGYRVVFEYANLLTARGHRVAIFYGPGTDDPRPDWFDLDVAVDTIVGESLDPSIFPAGDAIFATAWKTAPAVAARHSCAGAGFYLVQHYETWDGDAAEVDATWHLELHKVVIARWLWDIGVRLGQERHMTLIPIGIDLGLFNCSVAPSSRSPATVALLHHEHPWKGFQDGLNALERVQHEIPELRATTFGTYGVPEDLLPWVKFCPSPTGRNLVNLYNQNAIFLHSSWHEGWGLPPLEAMACGCAIVATEHGGTREFLNPTVASMVAPRDVPAMSEAVVSLIRDPERRIEMAQKGSVHAREFGWERSVEQLEILLSDHTDVKA